jgi:hypothetical protein
MIGPGGKVVEWPFEGGKNHSFKVVANGNWSISISGEWVDDQTFKGQGNGVTPFFYVKE